MKIQERIQEIISRAELSYSIWKGYIVKFNEGSFSELCYLIQKLSLQNSELIKYIKLKKINPLLDGFDLENFTIEEVENFIIPISNSQY